MNIKKIVVALLILPASQLWAADEKDETKPIILVAGRGGAQKVDGILKCKTKNDLDLLSKKLDCEIVGSEDYTIVFDVKSLGIRALRAKCELLKGIASISKDSDPPVVDFGKASPELSKSLSWAWRSNSASNYIADPSQAKVYLVPSLRLTLQNGKKTAKYEWWGDLDSSKKESLSQKISKEQAENPIKQKDIPVSPIEEGAESKNGIELLFSDAFKEDRLRYSAAKEASEWLERTSSKLYEQIDEAGQYIVKMLLGPYNEALWGNSLTAGTDFSKIGKGGKSWFEMQSNEQYSKYGFANPDDANRFLQGSKVGKIEYFFDFCVTMKMPDGNNITSSVQVRIK